MIRDINELALPEYATLRGATCTMAHMGEKSITAQVRIDGRTAPNFSQDWEVEFRGAKYIMPLRKPQAQKENTSLDSAVDLTFRHWAEYQLKRWYFFTVQPTATGTAVPDKYIASVSLTLENFCILLGQVLEYYYGDTIGVVLNSQWQGDPTPVTVEIERSTVWDVIMQMYDLWGVTWSIEPRADNDNTVKGGERYVIMVGYGSTEISHVFGYGHEGGLLKVERQVQSDDMKNMLIGRGGEKNLPYRYFKDVDPDNPTFAADPDWIPELRNIYFDRLRGKAFRDYIKGWKTNPNRQLTESDGTPITPYPHDDTVEPIAVEPYDEEYGAANWPYVLGHTDERFNPVEYVADKLVTAELEVIAEPGSPIDRYGPLMGILEDNDEIYPTIQGVTVAPYGRVDEAVDVEQVKSDDVADAVKADAVESDVDGASLTLEIARDGVAEFEITGPEFEVPPGMTANLWLTLTESGVERKVTRKAHVNPSTGAVVWEVKTEDIAFGNEYLVLENSLTMVKSVLEDTEEQPAINIGAGKYRYHARCTVQNNYPNADKAYVTVEVSSAKLEMREAGADDAGRWGNTFDVLIKNVWGTTKELWESDEAYSERVWGPILGDHLGEEAKMVFSTGALSLSEDYEFVIAGMPVHEERECSWETVENGTVVTHSYMSHWRLTLHKSDAELETTGLYVPSTRQQGKAGDMFYLIGIDLPHQYVLWAEERLDGYKTDQLKEVSEIKPTWVVEFDKVRLYREDGNGARLADEIREGASMRIADPRFILDTSAETLYIQSVTYTYAEATDTNAALSPDIEVVLSDRYETIANPVSTISGEITAIHRQLGSISNMEQLIRVVCDRLYMRKDGIEELSLSPTRFAGKVTSDNFRQGAIGGRGWGIYRDGQGNAVIEADSYVARKDFSVNNLVINQVTVMGGKEVSSAANMVVTDVVADADGYVCYFDQRQGTVKNLFEEGDVVLSEQFDSENTRQKYYRRRVLAVGPDYIRLGLESDGEGAPMKGDVICHYGSYTNAARRYVKVRDVIGGGYERYIEGLDSISSDGEEYYFVGRQSGERPRLFIGATDGDYIEWKDGKLIIKGELSILSTIGDKTLEEAIGNDYLHKALVNDTDISGGLIQTTAIRYGERDADGNFETRAGTSGTYDSDEPGGGLAFFAGGDRVDPKDEEAIEAGKSAAAFGVRMDGTGFMAGNTVRFEKNRMEIGDRLVATDGGLVMLDSEGEERLRMMADDINEDFDYYAIDSFEFSYKATNTKATYKQNTTYSGGLVMGGAIPLFGLTPLIHGTGVKTTIKFEYLVKDMTIADLPPSPELFPVYGTLTLQLIKGGTSVKTHRLPLAFLRYDGITDPDDASNRISGMVIGLSGTYTITTNIEENGPYFLLMSVSEPSGESWLEKDAYYSADIRGHVGVEHSDMTTNAKNGWSTIWGDVIGLASRNNLLLKAGKYALRLSPAEGIFINRNDGKGFVPL